MIKQAFWIGLGCGLVGLAMSLWVWGDLPGRVPIHWGPDGTPDNFASKTTGLLLMPIFAFAMPIILGVAARVDPRRTNIEKTWPMLRLIAIATGVFMVIVHGLTLQAMLTEQQELSPGIVLALVGALYAVIGNVLPKFKSNFMGGVRTPWSLSSEKNWHKTQRVSGWAMMVSGILTIPLALTLPAEASMWVIMPLLIAAPLIGVVYSFILYQSEVEV